MDSTQRYRYVLDFLISFGYLIYGAHDLHHNLHKPCLFIKKLNYYQKFSKLKVHFAPVKSFNAAPVLYPSYKVGSCLATTQKH